MDQKTRALYFSLFNEIGIISQLSRARMDATLPEGVSAPHFGVLNHLVRVKDGRTPLDLARAFQVPKTTMTHTLAGLEKQALIEMQPNPKDGRSKCAWLTPKGRRCRDQGIEDLGPDLSRFLKHLAPSKIKSLVDALAEIRKVMDADRDN